MQWTKQSLQSVMDSVGQNPVARNTLVNFVKSHPLKDLPDAGSENFDAWMTKTIASIYLHERNATQKEPSDPQTRQTLSQQDMDHVRDMVAALKKQITTLQAAEGSAKEAGTRDQDTRQWARPQGEMAQSPNDGLAKSAEQTGDSSKTFASTPQTQDAEVEQSPDEAQWKMIAIEDHRQDLICRLQESVSPFDARVLDRAAQTMTDALRAGQSMEEAVLMAREFVLKDAENGSKIDERLSDDDLQGLVMASPEAIAKAKKRKRAQIGQDLRLFALEGLRDEKTGSGGWGAVNPPRKSFFSSQNQRIMRRILALASEIERHELQRQRGEEVDEKAEARAWKKLMKLFDARAMDIMVRAGVAPERIESICRRITEQAPSSVASEKQSLGARVTSFLGGLFRGFSSAKPA